MEFSCVFWICFRGFGFLVLFWEFAVRLLFKDSDYKGLGFSGRGVEEKGRDFYGYFWDVGYWDFWVEVKGHSHMSDV